VWRDFTSCCFGGIQFHKFGPVDEKDRLLILSLESSQKAPTHGTIGFMMFLGQRFPKHFENPLYVLPYP
jgi:hypothetical protein